VGVEDTYDSIAEPYAARFCDELDRKPFDRDLLDRLADRMTGTVADIGCGPGHIGRRLADRGLDVVGIDVSEGMLTVARRRNPSVRFEHADVRDLPFADDELGGAVAFYSLIHLDALEPALAELHRVIRPGGPLCLAFHEGEETAHLDEWFERPVDITVRFRSKAEVVDATTAAGFTIESVENRAPYEDETTLRLYVTAIS
jgi:ubiquinone/menaquinone biosynthesis C-methylase UbiE